MNRIIFTTAMLMLGVMAYAQDGSLKSLPLDDMSAFKPQAGNWQIVGDVIMNPAVDVHHKPEAPAAETGKKKKKSKEEAAPAAPQAATFTAGRGVLLNINSGDKNSNLVTAFEHGDIEIEFEVMLPKGSNSGFYLQGRYEVQLFDSWGVKSAGFSDIGGIYRNWEREPAKSYMGKAPLTNAAKAPGLWQKMKINFRAPRFDESGKKIANARFVSVELNGIKIHDNVEVPLPTGGPVENNEKATGPIMIQGDHGPVALRNINYKLTKEIKASVSDVKYSIFRGRFNEFKDFTTLKPVKSGASKELTCEILDWENEYGAIYTGKVTVPENANYSFMLSHSGGGRLVVNGKTLVDVQRGDAWGRNQADIELNAGTYDFEIYNYKTASWMPPRLGLSVKTADSYWVPLHAYNSFPEDNEPTAPILITAGSTPRVLRAFVDFKRDRRQRLTHTVGIGEPTGINYVYDLDAGNIACVWRGDFVNATPMWHNRGDGSFRPLGAVQWLFVSQPLAFLASATEAFPQTGKEGEFRTKGYVIDKTGRPVFKYIYQGLEVEDKVTPEDNDRSLSHEVTIKNRGTKTGLYFKLAEGASIIAMPDGSYAVDDKQYYVKTTGAATIRDSNGKKELVVTVDGSTVKYSIIW
jgi:hypothetical protein